MIELVIDSRRRDLGGFEVGRILPWHQRRMVGPFVFFDHIGPVDFPPGIPRTVDVRPHPHIGLSTVTYLFDGEIVHRDSLGTLETIRPGALNLMSAGKGIVHSERSGAEARSVGAKLFGIQSWVALPRSHEEGEPAFVHYAEDRLPILSGAGVTMRLIAGEALGTRSPVETPMAMIYADVSLCGRRLDPLRPHLRGARHLYRLGRDRDRRRPLRAASAPGLPPRRPHHRACDRACPPDALGGEPMDGQRYIWWNFVSSRKERIEQAKADWKAARFDSVPGETEFIPLPDR